MDHSYCHSEERDCASSDVKKFADLGLFIYKARVGSLSTKDGRREYRRYWKNAVEMWLDIGYRLANCHPDTRASATVRRAACEHIRRQFYKANETQRQEFIRVLRVLGFRFDARMLEHMLEQIKSKHPG